MKYYINEQNDEKSHLIVASFLHMYQQATLTL